MLLKFSQLIARDFAAWIFAARYATNSPARDNTKGGVRKPASAGNCEALSSAIAMTERIRSDTTLKLWRTESLARSTKLKLLLMPRVNRRDHLAGLAQDVGRQAKRALFKSVWNCCSVAARHQSHCQWPPCHASAAAVRSLIVRPGQDPNSADFKFRNKNVRSVTFL